MCLFEKEPCGTANAPNIGYHTYLMIHGGHSQSCAELKQYCEK